MKAKFGIGIIGFGMMARSMVVDAQIKEKYGLQSEVRGICDTPEALLVLGDEYSLFYKTTNVDELVRREDIDIVAIFSPDHLHTEHCIKALTAGKHVICTKPMTASVADCEKIIELVRKKGLKFLVGQTCRFDPSFMRGKEMFDQGLLGETLFVEATYVHDLRDVYDKTPWRWQAPQRLIYGGACHPIDLVRWVCGDIDEVFCYGSKGNLHGKFPEEDNFIISMKFKNGKIGRVLALYGIVNPPMPHLGLSIMGTKGSFVNDTAILEGAGGYTDTTTIKTEKSEVFSHSLEVVRYLQHFEDCIINDKKPEVDEVDGAKVIAAGEACWESMKIGKPVKVRNDF